MSNTTSKNVAVVGTVGLPACYGGFESLVQNLVDFKSEYVNYQIFCSSKNYNHKMKEYHGAELIYLPVSANGASSIFYDMLSLLLCIIRKPDVVLILGVSGCLFLPIYKLFSKSKVITNIDGLEWRRNKWSSKVKWFLKKSEKMAVRYSDAVISDNKAIAEYVQDEYNIKSNVIAYGGDHALIQNDDNKKYEDENNYFLAICRIEPENNIDLILQAFESSSYKIKFMGNWSNSEYGVSLKSKYKDSHNIEILDPDYNIQNLYTLRKNCKGYIHGHSAGGTNPSLVEAMHFNIPIIAFDCSFNRFTTNGLAVYFNDFMELRNIVDKVSSDEIDIHNNELKAYAQEKYCWVNIAKFYEELY